MKKIYVGNLSYGVTEKELEEHFEKYGKIEDLTVIRDRETQRSKGFGFVTFETEESTQNAIDNSNGEDLDGRALKVSEAKERESRPSTGGGRGRSGGYGGGGRDNNGNGGRGGRY